MFMSTCSGPAEELAEEAPAGARASGSSLLGVAVPAGAPLAGRDTCLDACDVLAAAGPGGLATGLASDCSAHGVPPFSGVRSVSGWFSCERTGCRAALGSASEVTTRQPCR